MQSCCLPLKVGMGCSASASSPCASSPLEMLMTLELLTGRTSASVSGSLYRTMGAAAVVPRVVATSLSSLSGSRLGLELWTRRGRRRRRRHRRCSIRVDSDVDLSSSGSESATTRTPFDLFGFGVLCMGFSTISSLSVSAGSGAHNRIGILDWACESASSSF